MAKNENRTETPKDDVMTAATVPNGKGDEWVDIETDRAVYKPEHCRALPLQGHLLTTEVLSDGEGNSWRAFVFRTTAPTKGVNIEGDVVDVPANKLVLLPFTVKLRDALARYATNSDFMVEFRIQPTTKVKLGGGKTMWTYDVKAKRVPVKRDAMDRMLAAPPVRALPAPKAAPEGEVIEASEEIPF